jgi:hypothetical protein
MNAARTLLFLGIVTLLAMTADIRDSRAQGPDEKGAVLVTGFGVPGPAPMPVNSMPANVPTMPQPTRSPSERPDFLKGFLADVQTFDGAKVRRAGLEVLEEKPDINQDIQITPKVGPWVVFLIGCTGDEGPDQARKMVTEMRTNPTYRLPAYVFYFGAEERRKENDRVKKLIAEQKEFFQKNKIMPDEGLTVRHRTVDVQYAVLLGGYADADSARAALMRMRQLPAPDAKKVALDVRYSGMAGTKEGYAHYVNPFTRAFVCRNPTVKEQSGQMTKEDALKELAEVRGLNADEPYSLFNCRKSITLAVKGFQTPFMMKGQEATSTILGQTGLRQEGKDYAKLSAHNLAEALRKQQIEAYVLHSSFSSIVTVGGFDSLQDPALKYMQDVLAKKLNEGPYVQIQFFSQPMPMPVPR